VCSTAEKPYTNVAETSFRRRGIIYNSTHCNLRPFIVSNAKLRQRLPSLSCRWQTARCAASRPYVVNKGGRSVWLTGDGRRSNYVDNTCDRRRAVAKFFSKSRVLNKVPEGSTLVFGGTRISYQFIVGYAEGSPYAKDHLDRPFRQNSGTWLTDRRTDIGP